MHHTIRDISREGSQFRKEFRRQIRMLVVITLGFTIAFTWRQTIFDLSQSLVQFITKVQGSEELSILTSLFITIFSVLLIFLTSHFLKKE